MKTLEPVRLEFPVSVLFKSDPQPVGKVGQPDRGDPGPFRVCRELTAVGLPKATPMTMIPMPWLGLSALEEQDLRALYRFLWTVPPVSNKVETHPE